MTVRVPLVENMVLRLVGEPTTLYRLLWRAGGEHGWAWISLPVGARELPTWVSEASLRDLLRSGRLEPCPDDPFLPAQAGELLTESARRRRDERWAVLRELVEEPSRAIFFREARGPLIRERAFQCGVSDRSIYSWIRVFWQGGQVPDALAPRFDLRGGPGIPKSAGAEKRGTPPKKHTRTGINITPEIAEKLIDGGRRFKKAGDSWQQAYDETLRVHFPGSQSDLHGRMVESVVALEECPTLGQFKYWVTKDRRANRIAAARRTHGRNEYNTRHRPVLGQSTLREDGPGACFQVDACLGDLYLVSSLLDNQLIGRPVIYLVRDAFSTMIVGLHVGLDGPNWEGMRLALLNAFTDKVEFCARFGIPITEEDWPAHHVCRRLVGDRGELRSSRAADAIKPLRMTVSNTAPWRADWKGLVERSFRTMNDVTVHFLPGNVPKYTPRGGRDYRLDACFTVHAFTRVMIFHILRDIGVTRIKSSDTIPPGFPTHRRGNPRPRDVWHWGVEHNSGLLRSVAPEIVRSALLPWDNAGVRKHGRAGIEFNGLFYAPEELVHEDGSIYDESQFADWFVRGVDGGPRWVRGQWDPRNAGVFWLPAKGGGGPHRCRLIRGDAEFQGMSVQEVDHIRQVRAAASSLGDAEEHHLAALYHRQIADEVEAARAGQTGRPQVSGQREARRLEAIHLSHSQGHERPPSPPPPAPPAAESPMDTQYIPAPSHADLLDQLQRENS
jgi:putative transposase